MNRREMLAYVGAAAGTVSLGGCLSEYRDVAEEVGDTTTDEDATTDGDTITTETTAAAGRQVALADATLDVVDSGCGQPTNEATVEFRQAESAVGVTGTIAGSDACHTAELDDASYDAATGALTLTVVSDQEEGSEVCAQCITEIEYELTATFEGSLPGTVEVIHESMNETTTVATAESE